MPPSDSTVSQAGALPAAALMSIAAVERATGLGKDTLRAWERRYGFPLPQRDAAGVRGYPPPLVARLRLIRRALLAGERPGRLLSLPVAELDALLVRIAATAPPEAAGTTPGEVPASSAVFGDASPQTMAAPGRPMSGATPPRAAAGAIADVADVAACIAALRAGGAQGLRHWLTHGMARVGLGSFVTEGIAPLAVAIGHAWVDGRLAVYEEHLFSEAVQTVLRTALLPLQAGLAAGAPRILLTTVPGEEHGLGLLMAEVLMTLEACRCLALGVQTPLGDIVAASHAHRIDVVALGFSASLPPAQALAALAELRARLPAGVAIWAGGGAPVLRSRPLPGIQVLARLADIGPAIAAWRAGGGSPRGD